MKSDLLLNYNNKIRINLLIKMSSSIKGDMIILKVELIEINIWHCFLDELLYTLKDV